MPVYIRYAILTAHRYKRQESFSPIQDKVNNLTISIELVKFRPEFEMAKNQNGTVDQNAVKAAQASTFILLIIAFVLGSPVLVAITAAAQLIGATGVSWAPFQLLYRLVYRPLGIVKPKPRPDHHAPHRFASLVGGLFDAVGAALLFLGVPVAGWVLAWVVVVLANLNVWASFCMGCWMYYTFNRIGVPGFRHARIT